MKKQRKPGIGLLDLLINKSYTRTKNRCKRKGMAFKISREEFANMVLKPCSYCGEGPTRSPVKTYRGVVPQDIIGVDRIDSNIGYTVDNCVSCCTYCNKMKNDLGLEFFLRHIVKIAIHALRDLKWNIEK